MTQLKHFMRLLAVIRDASDEGMESREILKDLAIAFCMYAEENVARDEAEAILKATMETWGEA